MWHGRNERVQNRSEKAVRQLRVYELKGHFDFVFFGTIISQENLYFIDLSVLNCSTYPARIILRSESNLKSLNWYIHTRCCPMQLYAVSRDVPHARGNGIMWILSLVECKKNCTFLITGEHINLNIMISIILYYKLVKVDTQYILTISITTCMQTRRHLKWYCTRHCCFVVSLCQRDALKYSNGKCYRSFSRTRYTRNAQIKCSLQIRIKRDI